MKNIPLILVYFVLYFLGIWILKQYSPEADIGAFKIAVGLVTAMFWSVTILMTYYHRKDIRRAVRKAEFYFLWKILITGANRIVKKNPLNYPFFVMLSFSRSTILEYYLANYTLRESVLKFADEESKKQNRKTYKKRKRREKVEAMTDAEHEEYVYRVERWKLHLSYNDSKDVYRKAGIDI